MKTLAALIVTLIPATALAAANVAPGDDGIFIWIFLGFLALIVVGQLIPAVMLIIGLVRGVTARTETKTESK
jgi:hypothetical protein